MYKKLYSLIYLLFFSFYALGQPFQETILSSNFINPNALRIIDLDSNTYDDIVVSGSTELSWFKNTNGISFEKITILDSINNLMDFELVDFDSDSEIDIVGITSNTLFWLENHGDTSFVYHLISDTMTSLRKVRALDMDNDGDVDIVYSANINNLFNIYLYENTLSGFTNTYIDRVDFSRGIYLLDYNNDTCMDLLTKTNYYPFSTEELAILVNNGSNVFTEQQIYEKTGDIDISDALFVDINKNNTLDIVIGDFVQQEIYWLENCTLRHNILSGKKVRDILVADFDKDGINDISYKEENSSNFKIHVLKGAHAGLNNMVFTDLYNFNLEVSSTGLMALDVNKDSLPEIAYVSDARDEVAYLKNDSNLTFSLTKLSTAISLPESMRRVDLDMDGDMDIVSIGSNEEIVWLDNQSDSTYKQRVIASGLDNIIQLEVDDINGDGYLDIISTSSGNGKFIIWYNDGNQNFTSQYLTSSHTQLSTPSYFSICDLNNDSKKDFVIIASSTSSVNPKGIFWIQNNGNGNFSNPITIQSNLNLMGEVVTYDFDNDGNTDIVVANHEYGTTGLRIIKNNNNATSFTITTFSSFRAVSVRLGDVNNDGLMDFVCRNDDNNSIVWFKNNGAMSFTPNTIVMNEDRDVRFELCDDGNDSITDIFFYESYYGFTNASNHNAGLLKNDGNQNFTQTYYIQNTHNILSAIPADVDNDGDMDMFLGVDWEDKIAFYENKAVSLLVPTIINWPVASDLIYGDSLGLSILSGDSASVPGVFVFANTGYIPNAGVYAATLTFIPNQDTVYSRVSGLVNVQISKAEPVVFLWPQASNIEYNQSLSSSILSGDSTSVPGVFVFIYPSFTPPLGIYSASIAFVPSDSNNYDTIGGTIVLTVLKANPIINQWPLASEIRCGDTLGASVLSGGSASVAGSFQFDLPSMTHSTGTFVTNVTFIPSDSIHYHSVSSTVIVNVRGLDTTTIYDMFCDGSTYIFFGITLDSAGTYYHTLTSAISACDSVIQLVLGTNPTYFLTQNQTICDGDLFTWRGNMYSAPGIYYDSLTTTTSCDSIFALNLVVNYPDSINLAAAICQGGSYAFHGQNLTASGTYSHTLQNSFGCDSIIYLNLTVNPVDTTILNEYICNTQNYNFFGTLIDSSGTYFHTLSSLALCDSVIKLNLQFNSADTQSIYQSICFGDSVLYYGNWLSQPGIYYQNFQNQNNCDSVIAFSLTVNAHTFSSLNANACRIYTSPGGSQQWSQSGVYSDTLVNAAGCDSIISIHLTIHTMDTSLTYTPPVLSSNYANAIAYQWIDCNTQTPVAGAVSAAFAPATNGSYAVIITDSFCVDTSVCYLVSDVGIGTDAGISPGITVFPNPTNGSLTVSFDRLRKDIRLELFSVEGVSLLNSVYAETQRIELDIAQPSGVYFLVIQDKPSGITRHRIVVVR